MVAILEKMLNFMKMTSVGTIGSNKGIKVRHLFFKWNNESIYDEQWTFQATEGIIKHLEKIDAEPEEEMDVPDETTDFTLFDVSCCLKIILLKHRLFSALQIKLSKCIRE